MPWIKKQKRLIRHACNFPTPASYYELGSEWKCFWCKDHWVLVQSNLDPNRHVWERRNDALDFTKSFVNHPSNGLLIRPNSDSL